MDVLVTGGTGFIGTHLCGVLAGNGHQVTALARTPDADGLPDGVDQAVGDVTAYDSIAPQFEGHDAVVNLVALSPLFKPRGGPRRHFTVHLGGTEHCVRAAAEAGIDRFLQLSALGADPDGPTAYLRSKGQAEDVVTESDRDWTIVRPSVVFGDGGEFVPFTKRLAPWPVAPLPGGGRTRFQPIHVGDFVDVLADALVESAAVGEVYEIGGPEELTLAEVARMAHRADGRSLRVLPVPMGLAGVGLTIAGVIPFVPFGADQFRSLQVDNVVADNDLPVFGVEPADLTTLGDYLGRA